MDHERIDRRRFARALCASVGASLVAPALAPLAAARPRSADRTDGAIRLDSNENPYGPTPAVLEAIGRSRSAAGRYPDALEDRVTEAIARLHGVGPENVVLGCGSGEVLRMADMAFLGPGKCLVVAEPTFEAVVLYNRVTRADPVKVPLTPDFRHDLPAMAGACGAGAGMVYVCNPNNPTGTIVRRDEIAAFLGAVPRGVVVLVDEAYHHFVEDARYASASEWIGKAPDLVVARTFSKIYGLAGMRLGYGVGARERIAAMREHRIWSNANVAVLEAALASLDDPDGVARHRRLMNDTRRWLCGEMEKDGRRYIASEANFLMIDVGGDVGPVIAALKDRKIHVGRRFPSLSNWLRVSIGTRDEMEAFHAGLRAVVPASQREMAARFAS